MSEAKHTPGPWYWDEDGSALHGNKHCVLWAGNVPGGIDKTEGWAALLGSFNASDEESEANARLIAAAPELLVALVELQAMCERQTDFNDDGDGAMFDRAHAAITKATGAAQ